MFMLLQLLFLIRFDCSSMALLTPRPCMVKPDVLNSRLLLRAPFSFCLCLYEDNTSCYDAGVVLLPRKCTQHPPHHLVPVLLCCWWCFGMMSCKQQDFCLKKHIPTYICALCEKTFVPRRIKELLNGFKMLCAILKGTKKKQHPIFPSANNIRMRIIMLIQNARNHCPAKGLLVCELRYVILMPAIDLKREEHCVLGYQIP